MATGQMTFMEHLSYQYKSTNVLSKQLTTIKWVIVQKAPSVQLMRNQWDSLCPYYGLCKTLCLCVCTYSTSISVRWITNQSTWTLTAWPTCHKFLHGVPLQNKWSPTTHTHTLQKRMLLVFSDCFMRDTFSCDYSELTPSTSICRFVLECFRFYRFHLNCNR